MCVFFLRPFNCHVLVVLQPILEDSNNECCVFLLAVKWTFKETASFEETVCLSELYPVVVFVNISTNRVETAGC